MAAKKAPRSSTAPMTRRNSPGQAHRRMSKDLAGRGDIRCNHVRLFENLNGKKGKDRCELKGTVYRNFAWWCAEHDPGNIPNPTCRHELRSPLWGDEVCSMCGWVIEEDDDGS